MAKTGLTSYYGYRWYGPLTGRWKTRDPIGERGGVNLYGFLGNDGIARIDTFGLDEFEPQLPEFNEDTGKFESPGAPGIPAKPLPKPKDGPKQAVRPKQLTPPEQPNDAGEKSGCWDCVYQGELLYKIDPAEFEKFWRGVFEGFPQPEIDFEVGEKLYGLRQGKERPSRPFAKAAQMSATRGAACWKARTKVLDSLWKQYQDPQRMPYEKFKDFDLKNDCNCIDWESGVGWPNGDNAREYGLEPAPPGPERENPRGLD